MTETTPTAAEPDFDLDAFERYLRGLGLPFFTNAADALAALRKQLDEAREARGDCFEQFNDLMAECDRLRASNAQMASALREIVREITYEHCSRGKLRELARAALAHLATASQEAPASPSPDDKIAWDALAKVAQTPPPYAPASPSPGLRSQVENFQADARLRAAVIEECAMVITDELARMPPDHELTKIGWTRKDMCELLLRDLRALAQPAPASQEAPSPGPYQARIRKGMPADCCDYGVVSLATGREVCRVWTEADARLIERLLVTNASQEAIERGVNSYRRAAIVKLISGSVITTG